MITEILYRCPICAQFEWLQENRCRHCGVSVRLLSRGKLVVDGQEGDISLWYGKVLAHPLPDAGGRVIMESQRVRLSGERRKGIFKGLAGVHAILHGREHMDAGNIVLFRDGLDFQGASLKKTIPFESISAVTIESNTVIVDRRGGRTLYFDFLDEPGKKWEDCIQKALAEFYHPAHIVEFCPRIRFAESRDRAGEKRGRFSTIRVIAEQWYQNDMPLVSVFLKTIAGSLVRALLDIRMAGAENIPRRGGAILAANHVSLLDGIILGACLPRLARFMTKNSQFNHPLVRTVLKVGGAFPVMRYRTDVVAVRNALRVLSKDKLLGVFPEGERSWDGGRLPFKKGTLRLMLAAGLPVIPVGIAGVYELMPRWTHSFKRVPVRISVGRPISLPRISIVDQTDEDVRLADRQLGRAIQRLI